MAFELAVYQEDRHIVAHTLTCPTISSIPRTYQSGPMVKIGPGWRVVRCTRCQPGIFVVHVTAKSLRVNQYTTTDVGYHSTPEVESEPRGPNGLTHSMAEWNRVIHRNNPDSSFPPYGVTALDITHSENRDGWWKDAECKSDDERLGPWLERLFMNESNAHWTLTVQKVICSQCPVRAECLEQGVWGHEAWGVWGGANERERKLLRAKWIMEGRVDERPGRPRNPISGTDSAFNSRFVQREDGSGDTTTRGDNRLRDDETTRAGEDTGEDVSEVSVEREVRWPRTYKFAGSGWSSEGSGRG